VYGAKDRVRVMIIITAGFRIEGEVHILSGSRLTDALNAKAKDFFALTDARVFRAVDDTLLYAPSYIAVNRESIACIFPLDATV
jgi:hypothetical protein